MSPVAQTEIFAPCSTTEETGTGLGAAMIQRILRDHDGESFVTSTVEVGTVIRIEFPNPEA